MQFVLINSWIFDFENMIAHRSMSWPHYDPANIMSNYRLLTSINNEIFVQESDGQLRSFFCEPEDNFNYTINRAYMDFLFEKQVLV